MKFVLVIVLTLTVVPVCFAVPVEWPISEGGNGHYYKVVLSPDKPWLTWTQAKMLAETEDQDLGLPSYLATVTDSYEKEFILSVVSAAMSGVDPKPFEGHGFWLGSYQDHDAPDYSEPAGGWLWITGELWDYTNWAPREPNNNKGIEDHLEFTWKCSYASDGSWNDMPDSAGVPGYIVEYVPEPGMVLLLGLGAVLLRKRRG